MLKFTSRSKSMPRAVNGIANIVASRMSNCSVRSFPTVIGPALRATDAHLVWFCIQLSPQSVRLLAVRVVLAAMTDEREIVVRAMR